MTNLHTLEATRQYLEHWFLNQHRSNRWDPVESLLVRNGCYCGRKFIFGPYSAIWFVEEDEVKIFAPDGTVADRQSCDELLARKQHGAEIRRAA